MTGSARPLIAWASFLLAVLCLVAGICTGFRANSLLFLAVGALLTAAWAVGMFSAAWWLADEDTSRRLSAVDEEIDFIDSVIADVEQVGRR